MPFPLNTTTKKYEASITVSEIGISGEWKVHTIFLKDKKDNTEYLSHLTTQTNGEKIDFSTLHLNVTGVTSPPVPTDKEAPVLHSINVNSQQISVNEKIEIIAEVTDNESGVSTINATYKTPSGNSKSINLYQMYQDNLWVLIQLENMKKVVSGFFFPLYADKVGNSKTFTSYIDKKDNQKSLNHCKVTVSGTTVDSEAPVLRDISVSSQQVKANEKIEVRAKVTDNESGVSTVRVNYKKPNGMYNHLIYTKMQLVYLRAQLRLVNMKNG